MNDKSRFNSPLEKRLENWKVSAPVDSQMKQHVLRRITVGAAEKNHRNVEGGAWGWVLNNRMAVTSFACAAVLLACTVVLYTRQVRLNRELANSSQSYFMMINPVAHANVANEAMAASKEPSTIEMLAWMRDRFHLSREQFRQLVALHEDYNDRLVTLYKELAAIQTEYNSYETRRVKNEDIDFMALYDLLQKRDAVRKDSTETSAQLVELVLRVLTPEQKRAYLALMNHFTPLSDSTPESPTTHAGA
jgi:hypothetical protein